MTPLEGNLAALERHHPELVALVRGLALQPDVAQWSMSRQGPPSVRRAGVQWASAYHPVQEALRAVPDWSPADFVVLSSWGAGYLAEAVATRYADWPLVVAEQDAAWFVEVLRHRDLSSLLAHPSLILLVGPDPRPIGAFLRQYACRQVEVLHWRPAAEAAPEWGRAVLDQVSQAQAQARVNVATYRRFSGMWARNLRKNEAQAAGVSSLAHLAGLYRGVPAVVAAAGPSLADALDWMVAHRSCFVLIAVDTAWSSLAAHGFVPDLLLVLDGQYWNARHLDCPLPSTTRVVTEWIGPPRAFRLAPGRTYLAASSVPVLRHRERLRWEALPVLASGGSVATAAWSLALHLGCSEVAFAGLDLGYPRGQTHVPGSQFEEAVHRRAGRLVPAETAGLRLRGLEGLSSRPAVDGGAVLSDARMDLFRSWLSAAVQNHPEVRAVNLSARGSLVPGLEVPPADYGQGWTPLSPIDPPSTPLQRRAQEDGAPAPFETLRSALEPQAGQGAVEAAWSQALDYWGAEVWEAWAGRAYATWRRWPSAQSLAAVHEVLELACGWASWGNNFTECLKSDSRIADSSRE